MVTGVLLWLFWNSLPALLHDTNSIYSFRKQLKFSSLVVATTTTTTTNRPTPNIIIPINHKLITSGEALHFIHCHLYFI